MKITGVRRPNLIADPDVVTVAEIGNASEFEIRKFTFAHVDETSYFATEVTIYADDDMASVKLYKE